MSNKYLFNVQEDNPFLVFPKLQKKAEENFSANDIRDLSRGNPGLGFCPSEKGRKFFGFLTTIDAVLNSNKTYYRIHEKTENDLSDIEEKIKKYAQENFTGDVAAEHLKTLDEVVGKIISYAREEGLNFKKIDVLHGIFDYSTLAGGTYHAPKGELVARIVVAGLYRHFLNDQSISSDDITFTLGVNDGIGTLFKMLGKEGLGYLQEGDVVAVSAPAYAPYFNEVQMRKLVPIELKLNTKTGKADLSKLQANGKKIKAFFMINPNNPTGLSYEKAAIEEIAKIAQEHNAIIITDEIYGLFHDDFASVWSKAKNRTILLSGRSKIERSPGLRFGDVLISKEANKFLTEILKDVLTAADFKSQFIWMKAPGGTYGSFQHTAAVPGPSQILGMLQILLGAEERKQYVEMVNQNMDNFFNELGLPRNGAIYYGLFDLNTVPGNIKDDVSIEQKLYELATQKGVVLVPALKFFSEAEQKESDKTNFVRVSLPNLPPDKVVDAAKRIKEYLAGK
jgi:aspartate/methionine/tyrosine aminotransferase